MKIFQQIRSSVYDPLYYKEVLEERRLSSSIKYFLKYVLLLALLTSILLSINILPSLKSTVKSAVNSVLVQYPDDLEITIAKGKASTNKDEPIIFSLNIKEDKKETIKNFLVIDTKNPFTIDKMMSYQTASLLTSDSVVVNNSDKLQSYPLTKAEDQVITKSIVRGWGEKVEKFIPAMMPIIAILIFVVAFIVYMFSLVFVFFLAILVFLIFKILKIKASYKKAYQIGLHAITLPLVIDMLNFSGMNIHVRFLPTLLALLIVCLNLKDYSKPKSPEVIEATTPEAVV